MDLLSQVLETVKLRGTIYFHARFQSPWGMEIPAGQYANYHIITNGKCWLQTQQSKHPILLQKGDIALFPRGDSHSLVDSLQSDTVPATQLLKQPRKTQTNEIVFGGDGAASSSLICGHFEYDRQCQHPLFETLPGIIHLSSNDSQKSKWFISASELAALVSTEDSFGKQAVLHRLAESLFIQVLSDHLESLEDRSGFLAAIMDENIGRALKSMHAQIDHDWSLAELSTIANMSKSVFSARFNHAVGEPPIVYLARWRMLMAREMLSATTLPLCTISHRVGYQSEFSFSKAFKKMTGTTPSAFRKSSHA